MTFHAIIVAGGSGTRTGGRKQWMPLGGKPVLDWSIEAFAEAGARHIVVVVPEDDLDRARARYSTMARVVAGGADRAASVGQGIDVRPHPHINLSTVTFLQAGAILHRDSLGNRQRIEPGAVNLMTAGRGITHSERSPADARQSFSI